MGAYMKPLKLGIIGLSEGNGHPYSWSAIFNGYNRTLMENCPFPAIPNYLSNYNFPEDSISEAEVTHIWTQDKNISENIAETTYIKNVLDSYDEMVGEVDGLLLARDDYHSHKEFASIFLQSGIPVYIDKPLSVNEDRAKELLAMQNYPSQIFTGSALAFDPKIADLKKHIKSLGEIKFIFGSAPGSWDKYSIHLIDPLLSLLDADIQPQLINKFNFNNFVSVKYQFHENIMCNLQCLGGLASPIRISIIGSKGFHEINFDDPFHAFRNALKAFIVSIRSKQVIRSQKVILESIKMIQMGID